MKLSYSWLSDHLKDLPEPSVVADKLTSIGLEVEAIEDCDIAFNHFQVAEILSADHHPDADKLHICKVQFDPKQDPIQIVCGAPNARAGIKVILARPGAVVPNGGFTIKVGSIRGVESQGMMCSWKELGLGQDDEGIAELAQDAPVGTPLAKYHDLGGTVMEIGLTPNRGDASSVTGIARDLAAAGLGQLKPRDKVSVEATGNSKIELSSKVDNIYVAGRYVADVKNSVSPSWLVDRLRTMDQKSQGYIVDITNYLLFDLGRPMHAFDADQLGGSLVLDHAKDGEKFEALNGETYSLQQDDVVFRSANGEIASLAGIIGGKGSAVSDETKNIFLETSCFDPRQIAKTARRLHISTDASYRFERGVDLESVELALDTATSLVLVNGGKAAALQETGKRVDTKRLISVRLDQISQILGVTVPKKEMMLLAEKLGFKVIEQGSDIAKLEVPSWRTDIASVYSEISRPKELPALSAEQVKQIDQISHEHEFAGEIARHVDLEKFPAVSVDKQNGDIKGVSGDVDAIYQRDTFLRSFLASRGLYEIIGFSFVSNDKAELFEIRVKEDTLLNPLSQDLTQMRPSLLANMLEALSKNLAKGLGERQEACFFEIGSAFGSQGYRSMAAGLRGGFKPRSLVQKREEFTWRDVKEDAILALGEMGLSASSIGVEKGAPNYYHPGRSGKITLGPQKVLGYFGQIHPAVCEAYGIDSATCGFELNLEAIPLPKKRKGSNSFSSLQPLRKDLAFIVDSDVAAEVVVKAVSNSDRKDIDEVYLFDVFSGGNLGEGKKSVAVEVVFQPQKASFTDQEIASKMEMIAQSVSKACGGVLRDK